MLKKNLLVIAAAVLALAAAPVFAQEYKVGTWKTAQTIQPFYYQDYVPEGDQVDVFSFTNPADQKTALLAKSLDMCGATLAHAIHSASQGQPVVVVAALCNKCSALVVKKDGPIEKVEDLKGKRIGYVPGTMHEILLRETLTRRGLSPIKDVQLLRVDFFDMGTALAGGGIDAFLSGEPFPALAVDKGYGRILAYPYYGDAVGSINAGMLVRREAIEKNPDLVFSLVKAHAKATDYLNLHQDQWLKKASTFGTPLHILEKAAPNMEIAWDMDPDFVSRAKALGERMQALGVIQKQPDYDALFDLTFVNRLKDEGYPKP
ncbi:NitT/TauT family transport system substrate-binding protein [Desulfatibacillum alkenivorans DSM 16219]|jgi:NitT/TauT family transport system substrate-binding protein|uniref:NitT/TauT family transport system substrate-binding protein n=1 Tax=Desulfatibacillum alkenivorans DSM 16219 TaxID=1121393 RepID=A0A1M6FTG3_9BACT|nr:ABC transporter substrate-binding protein [Desulfatibacillum alkenivorans]SHJ00966.1 NitT/TauT family transport system substrate-binding protein [Desulfatibacillum alkenivorans DSM 16219]